MSKVLLAHGDGGLLTHQLIKELFLEAFDAEILCELSDAAGIACAEKMAFATDSFVIDPIFFPGGDIGKLAVAGTVNDLSVYGAVPKYISVSFILEEGLPWRTCAVLLFPWAKPPGKPALKLLQVIPKLWNGGNWIRFLSIHQVLENFWRIIPRRKISVKGMQS